MKNQVLFGCSKEKLKLLPDNSIDSIVTDPPYELGFMGKSWDNTGIAYDVELWKECLRVLKHGGHLLAFGGTRTYHRMAVAIEDAGFEVRDMIEWVYGSGFPKSLNIGKAVDKMQGNDREVVGEKVRGDVQKAKESGSGYLADHANRNNVKQFGYGTETLTKGNSEWEGWGTALKPSHEPICLARKPIEKGLSIAENCLKWGVGGINIDESRVGEDLIKGQKAGQGFNNVKGFGVNTKQGDEEAKEYTSQDTVGRFPANLIHDNSEEVQNCFPNTNPSKKAHRGNGSDGSNGIYGVYGGESTIRGHDDNGGNASRFFKSILYYPKASKSERNKGCEELPLKEAPASARSKPADGRESALGSPRGNFHPTVKPVSLISYLIKLITPKGGTVLDPFGGSGTTAVSCIENNFNYVIIEKEADHIPIIKARIKAANKEEAPIEEQTLAQLSLNL